jgi:hypothetical protein
MTKVGARVSTRAKIAFFRSVGTLWTGASGWMMGAIEEMADELVEFPGKPDQVAVFLREELEGIAQSQSDCWRSKWVWAKRASIGVSWRVPGLC